MEYPKRSKVAEGVSYVHKKESLDDKWPGSTQGAQGIWQTKINFVKQGHHYQDLDTVNWITENSQRPVKHQLFLRLLLTDRATLPHLHGVVFLFFLGIHLFGHPDTSSNSDTSVYPSHLVLPSLIPTFRHLAGVFCLLAYPHHGHSKTLIDITSIPVVKSITCPTLPNTALARFLRKRQRYCRRRCTGL